MTKKITHQRLYNISLYYLSRFDASADKVRQMLKRRIAKAAQQGQDIPPETNEWINDIVSKVIHLGYVDDKRYGENQVRIMAAQGKSARFMAVKLNQAGLDAEVIETVLSTADTDDLERAKILVERKKMGWMRPENMQKEYYKKDLAALGRAGFSYETASLALKVSEDL